MFPLFLKVNYVTNTIFYLDKNVTWTILTLGQKLHLDNVHLDNNGTWTIMSLGQCSLGQSALGQKSTWTIFTWKKITTFLKGGKSYELIDIKLVWNWKLVIIAKVPFL